MPLFFFCAPEVFNFTSAPEKKKKVSIDPSSNQHTQSFNPVLNITGPNVSFPHTHTHEGMINTFFWNSIKNIAYRRLIFKPLLISMCSHCAFTSCLSPCVSLHLLTNNCKTFQQTPLFSTKE